MRPFVLLLLTCFVFQPVSSQDMTEQFKHLTVRDGLSHSWVKCFLLDKAGYLWVGTANGINKFNGISFKTYQFSSSKPQGLNHNNINVIFEDSKGCIWVGTQAGLNYYDRDKDEFFAISSIDNFISSIYELAGGKFLVGTAGGLFLFNKNDFKSKQLYNDIYVEEILCDNNHNFWLATYSGLKLLDTTDYSVFTVPLPMDKGNPVRNILIHSIYQDSKGGIWIGTNSDGLFYLPHPVNNARSPLILNFRHDPANEQSISKGTIYCIAEDNTSKLWFGIENAGISTLDLNAFNGRTPGFNHLKHNPVDLSTLSDNSIHGLYSDRHGTMWVGTFGGGISFHNDLLQRFEHHKYVPGSKNSINNNHVNVIYEDDKFLWIGTELGLNRLNKQKKQFEYYTYDYKNPQSIGSNAVLTICRDSSSNIWVGAWEGGLNLFNEKSKSFRHFSLSVNNQSSFKEKNISHIIADNKDNLWISLIGSGLRRFNTKTGEVKAFIEDFDHNSISCNWVNTLLIGSDKNLWISTTEALDIMNLETGIFTSFTHNPSDSRSISYNMATMLFEDSRKNLWICTSNGLNVFNRADSSFIHFIQPEGLKNNSIKAITEDSDGNLWFSTSRSITKMERGVDMPVSPKYKTYHIDIQNQNFEFKDRSVFRNAEGKIYFGSTYGFFAFEPDRINENRQIPEIVFTNLLIFNDPVKIGAKDSPLENDISVTNELVLNRKQSVFTIEFAALNYLSPEKNQYAFYLEGFEKKWNYVGQKRSATYTNLDPGKYTFRVKASNNDGFWNEEGISLSVVILPAWWQTRIAWLGYLLIILLVFYFFRKHTIISVNLKNELWKEHLEKQKSEELHQLKQQFFTNMSHELRTPLTLIIGPLKKLISEKNGSEILETIYRNAARLKTLVDQIMDFSKIESQMMKLSLERKDVIAVLYSTIKDFSEFALQRNISLVFKTSLSKCLADIDEDKFEKIISNIISNAIKNTPECGKVTLSVHYDSLQELLLITINDTGRGIPEGEIEHIFDRYYTGSNQAAANNGTGIGLDLTKKLVEMHSGTIGVSSILEVGTTFVLKFPMQVFDPEFSPVNELLIKPDKRLPVKFPEIKAADFKHDKTILIIDDNPEICEFIKAILNDHYNVVVELNPLESINKIITYLPDLIISDVMMPGLDGFELCKKIKTDLRFSHIPVILLTAKASTHDHITGYETGADDYIYKPFDEELLMVRVKNLIAQKENLRKFFIGSDGIINPKVKANNLDISFIDRVLEQIQQQYPDPDFNVNTIIDKLGMSRSIFYKKFKALSDQSVNDLIRNFRLKKAAEMLAGGQFTVSQVAYDCGFSDPAYFSKVFKEFYKVSPKDYNSSQTEAG